ncbi:Ubiquinone biosynthesis protein COQ9, mitochondrial [Hypsizygus marmoreus]|uniref:Ubiquinone biosynthesis protein n=1 Tax=Hypsizygus marmoreus TaxID=39966 RepID=A0A369JVM3_HYPMA|nr:Ubiquinone biosynthesis protein COQ9, mitochondrial [Hypsizygus marmoreus]
MSTRSRLLQHAIPLIKTHGFTREALARSVLVLPSPEAHPEPLSETAISALFGHGDLARRTLIRAWLDGGVQKIQAAPPGSTMKQVLRARLELNEPVLQHLPEAFALLASPNSGLPPLDPRPAFQHATKVADEACYATGDASLQLAWFARRASLAAIYSTAELHQLTSPKTAYAFLDSLLDSSSSLKSTLDEVNLFSSYFVKSWAGILKSSGVF